MGFKCIPVALCLHYLFHFFSGFLFEFLFSFFFLFFCEEYRIGLYCFYTWRSVHRLAVLSELLANRLIILLSLCLVFLELSAQFFLLLVEIVFHLLLSS